MSNNSKTTTVKVTIATPVVIKALAAGEPALETKSYRLRCTNGINV